MPRAGADWQPLPSQRPARDSDADEVSRLKEELEKARKDVAEANRKRMCAEKRVRTLEDEAEEQRRKVGKMPSSTLDRKASEICERWCDQYDAEQIGELGMAVVYKAQKHHKTCMADQIRRSAIFKKMLPGIHAKRDLKIAAHIREEIFPPGRSALLRLMANNSKRECHMISQSFKWKRKKGGKKMRARLCKDSCVAMPVPFELSDIADAEAKARVDSGLVLKEHSDKRGADICGEPYGLDTCIHRSLLVRARLEHAPRCARAHRLRVISPPRLPSPQEAEEKKRSGGMATNGTRKDWDARRGRDNPHLVLVAGDGMTKGVVIGHSLGSTEYLAQSSSDFSKWVFYSEYKTAEDNLILRARLKNVLPDLARLYETRELMPGGVPCVPPVYINIVLTGDRPWLRHVTGCSSNAADAVGAPHCTCHSKQLFDFTMPRRTHHKGISFEQHCHRSHTPLHVALGLPAPAKWKFKCDICGEVNLFFSSLTSLAPPRGHPPLLPLARRSAPRPRNLASSIPSD